jgi:hypothetical protein
MKKEYSSKENLSKERIIELIGIIQLRFEKNIELHKGIEWANVQKKLEVNPSKLTSLTKRLLTF